MISETVAPLRLPAYRLLLAGRTVSTLGNSFAIVGTGMPCVGPARVRVFLGGHPVAALELNAQGGFSATVIVDNADPALPRFKVLTTGEQITLTAGSWPIAVKLAADQPAGCSVTANYNGQAIFQ